MHPTLDWPALGLSMSAYRACIALAAATCLALGPYWVARLEWLDRRRVLHAMLVLAIAAFAGARLHFVLNQWPLFAAAPLTALQFWSGGLHAGGAILLLAVALPPVLRWRGLPPARFADAFAPTVAVGIAIARLGCFLHGCCFGTPSALPWAVASPPHTFVYHFHLDEGLIAGGVPHALPIHPLPLYFAAAALGIAAVAAWLHRRKRYDGEVALVALALFGTSTALLEPLRADTHSGIWWGPLPQLTWVALAIALGAFAGLVAGDYRHRRRAARTLEVARACRVALRKALP
jgi:phosphatidylglycerol:prolipoprotein diacylglycerol transferase